MIKIDGEPIDLGSFPDGSILVKYSVAPHQKMGHAKIAWYYENDREFLALIYLVNHLRANDVQDISLYMPYIPNARMDRVKNPEDVFTLKYFVSILNSLNFTRVEVLDPHSSVSEALINNLCVLTAESYTKEAILRMKEKGGVDTDHILIFYPDSGAAKRYSDMLQRYYIYGCKRRNWETGEIEGLDIIDNGFDINGRDILIVDDICSRGGTFLHSANKLKELGARDIYLYVSHCENTILEGDLLKGDLIKKVYTTNSIFTKEHEKIEVLK